MAESKLTLKIGNIEFTGEGDSTWVSQQFDKFVQKAQDLVKLTPSTDSTAHKLMGIDKSIGAKPLATFLKEHGAITNQNKKFLATAIWLEAKGQNRMKTGDISKALRDNNQSRLGNPSQRLADNIGKGYCERDGASFFVTDDGKKSM